MTFMPKFEASVADPEAAMQLLRTQCRDGLSDLLENIEGSERKLDYMERLDAELDIIQSKNFSNYFLIVADYVRWARTNQIGVGPGRGSGPCSLVAYVLEITRVDPVKYQLPFERFVNPDKESLPDFDLDFCADRCDEIVQYLQRRYGTERLAQISSSDKTPLSSRLIIGDRSLEELVPIYAHQDENVLTTELTISEAAKAGLVRFNVIGNKTLTLIERVIREIRLTDKEIDIDCIPLDDAGTYTTLIMGDTNCISNLPGGEHYGNIFKLVKPVNFDTLCAAIALSFPALHARAFSYIEPPLGMDSIQAYFPKYQTITKETHGHLLYQEQVMDVVHEVAGFSYAQSDLFRRALKQKNHPEIVTYRAKFLDGAVKNGYAQSEADAIYQRIAEMGDAYFTKSHAVAYGVLVYQLMWLQTHFPTEWAAVSSR